MKLFKSISRHIDLILQSTRDFLSGAIPYVGFPENDNLGDVELFNLSKRYLPYKYYSFNVAKRGRYTRLATGRSKYFLVGGGTLMFSEQILIECETLMQMGLTPLFLGTGAGELIQKNNQDLVSRWKKVLSASSFRAVRGEHTIRTLKDLGLDACLSGDLGYLLNLDFERPVESEDYIVITPRSIRPTVYEYYHEDFETRNKLKALVRELVANQIRVIIYAVSIDDYAVVRGWVKSLGESVEYIEYNSDFNKYVSVLSKARLLVSMRMHPGIFALSMGVLPIELDKRIKFKDSFSLISEDSDVFSLLDPNEISADELVKLVLSRYSSESETKRLKRFDLVKKWALSQRDYCMSLPS